MYIYFLAKLSELLDTVFFVLRKKENQITFLHLYHHTVMPMISWGTTKYYPGGHGTFIGMYNICSLSLLCIINRLNLVFDSITSFIVFSFFFFSGVINSFVHIIMYTYYFLAALLPQYQKYLWWKKYITTLQMVKFIIIF